MRKGMTLVEILLTLAIIGILAAAAVPAFFGSRNNSVHTEMANKVLGMLSQQRMRAMSHNLETDILVDEARHRLTPRMASYFNNNMVNIVRDDGTKATLDFANDARIANTPLPIVDIQMLRNGNLLSGSMAVRFSSNGIVRVLYNNTVFEGPAVEQFSLRILRREKNGATITGVYDIHLGALSKPLLVAKDIKP